MKSKNRKSRKRMDFVDFTFIAELLICISVIWWIFAIFGPIMETIEFPTNGYAMIIGYSICLAISVLLFRQFYLMRTEKKILPGQKYKGIVFEKIVPVMIPMLLGSFFISLSVGGTIIYVLKWSVYTQIDSFIILSLIILFAIVGTVIIYIGLKWILKNEKNTVANPHVEQRDMRRRYK